LFITAFEATVLRARGLIACLEKLEREVNFGNNYNQCVLKYFQIALSVSYKKSPTISIVITSISLKAG
jgi:hypothetical protein